MLITPLFDTYSIFLNIRKKCLKHEERHNVVRILVIHVAFCVNKLYDDTLSKVTIIPLKKSCMFSYDTQHL